MDLHESIEQYKQQFMQDVEAPDHELRAAALALLEEFLGDYASLQTLEALAVEDLEEFFVDWYLRRPGARAPIAVALLDTVRGWLGWCDATYGCRLDEVFAPLCNRLRVDLPRILEAWQLIEERLRRSRHEEEAGLAGLGTPAGSSLISSGINRVIRPAEIDYANAREDYFRVETIAEESVTLQSPTGKALGEEGIGPVRVPKRAAVRLRAGDVLYVEVAPGPGGVWEILEISQALPGGYRLSDGCLNG